MTALARVPVLFALQDTHWPFEIFSGNVAMALLDGLDLDLSRLWIIPHVRGGPLFGLLAAPLYLLFGPSEVTLKLVPLLWHAATVAVMVAALGRIFGRRAAWCALALGVCAPPLLVKLSVIGFATHDESSLVAALSLLVAAPLATGEGGSRLRWAGLGAVLGFAGFFHLQALLAVALVLGLLFVSRPLATLRGAPWLVLAAALFAAPSWLFDSGNLDLLRIQSDGRTGVSLIQATPAPDGEVTLYSRADKAHAVLTEGLAPVLEFGDVPVPRKLLARAWWWLAFAAGSLALWQERRAVLSRPWLQAEGARLLVLYPALLALLLTVAWVSSGMEMQQWYAAGALESRRGALALWGLVMLVPVAGSSRGGRLGPVLVGALCALGLVGQVGVVAGAAERSGPNRGESYEQFITQLEHHSGRDEVVLLQTLARIDRGDRRFTTLRFRVPSLISQARKPLEEALAWARRGDDRRLRLLRLTHVGRLVGESRDTAAHEALFAAPALRSLMPVEQVALMHGVGLGAGAMRLRPSARKSLDGPEPFQAWLVYTCPPQWTTPLFEGLGFKVGADHDPYLRLFRRELAAFDRLPDAAAEAFYRGLGWGLRQRFSTGPSEAPGDARVLADVPVGRRESFLDGLLGRRWPLEVQALSDG